VKENLYSAQKKCMLAQRELSKKVESFKSRFFLSN